VSAAPGSSGERGAHEELLLALVEQLDREEAPDEAELLRRFPDLEDRIESLCGAARELRDLTASLEAIPRPLEAGTELGDFTVESLLASGGMGTVYRARQRSLGDRPVALKVLSLTELDEPDRGRFQREALAAASLHHPHLAEVYGFGSRDQVLFYGMELVEGPSLDDILRERAGSAAMGDELADRRRLVARVAEVARALEEVHAAGLVHRDVKPGNVVLRERADGAESAVLVDFGLVRSPGRDRPADLGTSSVTASYAPPEQLLVGEVDPRSDVFSLGVALHDLLARRLPQDRPRAAVGLEPIAELVPGVDADLAAILARATDPMLEHRYADARAFRRDLEAWLAGAPAAARRQGAIERAARWVRARPRAAGAVLAAALVMVLAGLWLWDQLANRREARRALDAGDLEEGGDRLVRIPLFAAEMFLDSELEALRYGLDHDLGAPVPTVYAHLAADEDEQALTRAAAYIERDGLGERPLLCSFLHWASEQPGHRTVALKQVARLFFDRPDTSPGDVGMSRPFRELLMEVPYGTASTMDRRWALTALSGCATLADVPGILAWIRDLPHVSKHKEDFRLARCSMERIIRRFTDPSIFPEASFPSPAAFVEEVHALLAELGECGPPGLADTRSRRTSADVVVAVILFERARGRHLPIAGLLDGTFTPMGEAFLRAAAGDPALAEQIRTSGSYAGTFHEGILGEICGMLDETDLSSTAWEWVSDDLSHDPLARTEFDNAVQRGRRRLLGRRPEFEADRRTVLRWSLEPMGEAIELDRVGDSSPLPGALARWSFRGSRIATSGAAESARATPDFFYSQGDSAANPLDDHWCLGPNSCSEVVLGCQLDPGSAEKILKLEMDLLVGSRPLMPNEGEFELEVWVGDERIDSVPLRQHGYTGPHTTDPLQIRRGALAADEHSITIRPVSGTAVCWFLEVRLMAIE